jgi:hypothetical protein
MRRPNRAWLAAPAVVLADVTYNIVVGGSPALSNQTGTAILQNGTWKVGDASFCGLLALENGGKTSGLPAACHIAN